MRKNVRRYVPVGVRSEISEGMAPNPNGGWVRFGVHMDLRNALREIRELALWHCDEEADPADESPEDMTAHVNGLIVQTCDKALGKP